MMRKTKYLVISPLVSCDHGFLAYKITILGFINKKSGEDEQYA